MAQIEDALKLENWLSIVTFDVFKYMSFGGEVVITQDDDGFSVKFVGVNTDSPGMNKKLLRSMVETAAREPTP